MEMKFERDPDGGWYAVIPEWPHGREELEMVCGADTLLETLASGSQIELEFNLDDPTGMHTLLANGKGDGEYTVNSSDPAIDRLDIWLCPVTLFVLGHYPETIHFRPKVMAE